AVFALPPVRAQQFGGALALGEEELLVGETRNEAWPGQVYVYRVNAEGVWEEAQRLTVPRAKEPDGFGRALALDGDRLLVGANLSDREAGAAYVFERNGAGRWGLVTRLATGGAGARFGTSVALAGETALVAAPRQGEVGAVYVYRRTEWGNWVQAARLEAPGGQPGDRFGTGLATDGTTVLVGAPGRGYVDVFRQKTAGSWEHVTRWEGPGSDAGFGTRVLLNGSMAFVAAPGAGGGVGAVFVYQETEDGVTWALRDVLGPFILEPARLGSALALEGDHLWVGAPFTRSGGAVVRFHRGAKGAWDAVDVYVDTLDAGAARLGSTLAVGYGWAAVGAVGVDNGAGAVRVLAQDNTTWQPVQLIAPPLRHFEPVTGGAVACEKGMAAAFPCDRVDLLAFLPVQNFGGGRGTETNDVWGWTDPETGREYAIVGRTDGTAFVDITDPYHPVFLGDLP
ncbi:MAG: hypothetical protein D6746_00210, partial [Bacteroidetes bacterium]